jgi:hypothetical protein
VKLAKMAGADVKCLYVKTNKSDVTKKQLKMGKDFEEEPIEFFVIDSDEVKETILDFILYKEIDILTMVSYKKRFQGLFQPD